MNKPIQNQISLVNNQLNRLNTLLQTQFSSIQDQLAANSTENQRLQKDLERALAEAQSARNEIAKLQGLLYSAKARQHLYRAWQVLIGNSHYCRQSPVKPGGAATKNYKLQVPWHTHVWRAAKSPFLPNDPPWHTHFYRATHSALGNSRYAPIPRRYEKVTVPWHTHLYRVGHSLIVRAEKPWHTHLYRAFKSLQGDKRFAPPQIFKPEILELANLRRSLPVAIDRLNAEINLVKKRDSRKFYALKSSLREIELAYTHLRKKNFEDSPKNLAIAKHLPPKLRQLKRKLAQFSRPPAEIPAPSSGQLSVSIVINTLNRAASLSKTLHSLQWLKYRGPFEVIVINGPSTDHTEEVLARWQGKIKTGQSPKANLSLSRNLGIAMARGDIVAFIDDDAIPEPEWLDDIVSAYSDLETGAVGGMVYDDTGRKFQAGFTFLNRLVEPDFSLKQPTPNLCFPHSALMPHMLGTNSTFRRQALLEIGGFDEEYEYFLDETDVQLRIVDAGYIIRQSPSAFIHHKSAPSALRDANRFTNSFYPVLKNKTYFLERHSLQHYSPRECEESWQTFVRHKREYYQRAIEKKLTTEAIFPQLEKEAEEAHNMGKKRAALPRESIFNQPASLPYQDIRFLEFKTIACPGQKNILFISANLPPEKKGGIGRFTRDTAEALAAAGHIVHIITKTEEDCRIDLEDGVWIHRIKISPSLRDEDPLYPHIPKEIWQWSESAFEEASRIAEHRSIDAIEAPIWDCEGVAFLLKRRWPLITSLQTTLRFWLDSNPGMLANEHWMNAFGRPMIALETKMMRESDAIHSISQAIWREIELKYDFQFNKNRLTTIHLGLKDEIIPKQNSKEGPITVLFVGRLESRKGIDILLEAIPLVLRAAPEARFRIIGNDKLPMKESNRTYKEAFLSSDEGKAFGDKILFEGELSDEAVADAYNDCDIFVSPSRFESFGLIFLEAMRAGKPVIGCNAGGMPEIISNGVNGFLVESGNAPELASAILNLIQNPAKRLLLGKQGRELFASSFSIASKVPENIALFEKAQAQHKTRETKISLVNSLCVKHDGISNSICNEIKSLLEVSDARLYAGTCDYDWIPFTRVYQPADLAAEPHFNESHLVLFHFGIFYPLFDILKYPSKAKRVVIFHNITPKEFASSPEALKLSEASFKQIENINHADHVICDSQENLRILKEAGVKIPSTVISLAVDSPYSAPETKPSFNDGIIRIIFLGRFVTSKGPTELLEAVLKIVPGTMGRKLQIDMVGNRDFSDLKVLEAVKELSVTAQEAYGGNLEVRFHESAQESLKWQILHDADIFVLPSYHEGFCLPIVEAYSQGCKVISYENSNIPAISGNMALLCATGNVEALATHLESTLDLVSSAHWKKIGGGYQQYRDQAVTYAQTFASKNIRRKFAALLESISGKKIGSSPQDI